MTDYLNLAISAVIEAGKVILEVYDSKDFDVQLKSDNSPLTRADILSHNIIKSFLEKTGIPILSEEGKETPYEVRKHWSKLWIIDPIDGTKEFIKRNGEFTINVALIENQEPILGVVYAPDLGDLYFSTKEKGAYKILINPNINDMDCLLKNAKKLPLKKENKSFTVVASRSHMSKETEIFINDLRKQFGVVDLISKGSSLKLCMVAEGVAQCYPRFAPTMEWDTAAGQAICEYAGFNVIDYDTKKKMIYNRPNLLNNWFVVK
ncbi:3'(2'),5'-bisphosphate nucleotidase CysQ [Pseudotenacibaculum sp. MALMAid0570]|uniref:3'(2'),5'-bisphosphate nucleotidase CysQ n=1 Tax=Pseudotenacibaculum sp. MALMAid0570 TaxID=3143938 RepID=UPI0032DED721